MQSGKPGTGRLKTWRADMTNRDQEILDSIAELIPRLTHIQKEKLLSFGEGMAFANDEKNYPFTEDEKKQQIG